MSGNLTTLKNDVKKIYLDVNLRWPSRTQVGDPIGSFFGYVVEGVYQDSADIANSPQTVRRVGRFKIQGC